MEPELDKRLRSIEVELKYRLSGDSPPTTFVLKVKWSDNFRRIKKHITESLDIQGKLTCGGDDFPNKKLLDYTPQETKFVLTAERKPRDLKHYGIKLQLPEDILTEGATKSGRPSIVDDTKTDREGLSTEEDGKVEVKVARTTTIINLKHKLQNILGIPVEEQGIHASGREYPMGMNVMQLPKPLVVKWQRNESLPPSKPSAVPVLVKKTVPQKSSIMSSGAPYLISKRKAHEFSTSPKKPKAAETSQNTVSVPMQHATYETLYQIGEKFEEFQKDKNKTLVVACTHSRNEANKVDITSTVLTGHSKVATELGKLQTELAG